MQELGSEYGMYLVWVISILLAVAGTKYITEYRSRRKSK